MSTLGGENRGAEVSQSLKDVEAALRAALESSEVPVTTLKPVVDHSQFSRATVNKRLGDLVSSGECESGELLGTTYYWMDAPEMETSGGLSAVQLDAFFRFLSAGKVDLSNFGNAWLGMAISTVLGIVLMGYSAFSNPTVLVQIAAFAVGCFFTLMGGALMIVTAASAVDEYSDHLRDTLDRVVR